ncbi:Peptidoglycan/LPS O-acetylase OafA/YrhL, contains acyltransferase and SGNH-hydrolase domains [Chitinophaga sp. CF118]|uniref:acyltransferase family protein n=1 Tax=Chitinophaga sp. CF118 TaxID=1884367 RepID=UPI0008EAF267|nr:acyltransferase [Chitinophaga sp. CF118]SFD02730.1 Peptidoglycan/LPS O-acetylase OafA/YrhL, contains acyltransferase and SGNH-hydrolase domains [Chitinophaga sp. CF118]
MAPQSSGHQYFFSLDVIRGIAAFIVVLSHWQFFFYTDDFMPPLTLEGVGLPLYRYLAMFYNLAPYAVDLFFLLSGFIFFWFYGDKIASRKTSFNNFIVFRLSRLYPVHFITLMSLVVLQPIMYNLNGHYFIVHNNDTPHFILHLFLIHTWGFEKAPSFSGFNGPSWSASVEVLLYLVFFVLCWFKLNHKKLVIIAIIVSAPIIQYIYPMVGQGLYSFFLGALVYHTYKWAIQKNNARKITNSVIALSILLWIFILCEYTFSFTRTASMVWLQKLLPAKSIAADTRLFDIARNTFFRSVISPLFVLTLALLEYSYGNFKIKWISVLRNASYAIYLIHFPLMVLFVIITDFFSISRDIYHSPLTLLLFYAILLPLSISINYYYELPVQQMLRKKLTNRSPVPAEVTT